LSGSSQIRGIQRIPSATTVPKRSTTKSAIIKAILRIIGKGAMIGPWNRIVRIMLGRGEEEAGAEHFRYPKKTPRKSTQFSRGFGGGGESSLARKAYARQMNYSA
jgi:hypothetical protein